MLRYRLPWLLSMLTRMTRASEVCCPRRGTRELLGVKLVGQGPGGSMFRDSCRQCGVTETAALLSCVMRTTRLPPHCIQSTDEHTALTHSPHAREPEDHTVRVHPQGWVYVILSHTNHSSLSEKQRDTRPIYTQSRVHKRILSREHTVCVHRCVHSWKPTVPHQKAAGRPHA